MARTLLFLSLFLFINSCCAQPTPSNDECADAEPIIKPGSFVVGTRLDCFLDNSLLCGTEIGENNVWYTFNSATYSQVIITAQTVFGGSGNPNFHLFSGECGDLVCLAFGNLDIQFTSLSPGEEYLLVVADTVPLPNPAPFKFYFQLTNGDACVDAVEIFSGTPEYNILYNDAQDSIPGANVYPCSIANHGDVWFYFVTGPAENNVELSLCNSYNTYFDSVIYLYRGDDCGYLQCISAEDDLEGCGSNSIITAIVLPDTKYYVAITGYQDYSKGPFQLDLTLSNGPNQLNNECDSAESLTSGTIVAGNNLGASFDASSICFFTSLGANVWYTFETSTIVTALVSFCPIFGGSTTFTEIEIIFLESVCEASQCFDILFNPADCPTTPAVSQTLTGASIHYLGIGAATVDYFTFYFALQVGEDDCTAAAPLDTDAETSNYPSTTINATPDEVNSCFSFVPFTQGKNIWFTYVPSETFVIISTCPDFGGSVTGDPVYMFLYQGIDCATFTCIARSDTVFCGTNGAQIASPVASGETHYVSLASAPESVGSSFNFYFALENISRYPDNDFCERAFEVADTITAGFLDGASSGAPTGYCGPSYRNNVYDKNVWYRFNSGSNEYASLQIYSAFFDPIITIYQGECDSLACIDSVLGNYLLEVMLQTDSVHHFYIGSDYNGFGDFEFEFETCLGTDLDADAIVDCVDYCTFCQTSYFIDFPSCSERLGSDQFDLFDGLVRVVIGGTSSALLNTNDACQVDLGRCGSMNFPFECKSSSLCEIEFIFQYQSVRRFAFEIVTESFSDDGSRNVDVTLYNSFREPTPLAPIDRSSTPCQVASVFSLDSYMLPVASMKVSVNGQWGLRYVSYAYEECSGCNDGDACTINDEYCEGDAACAGAPACPISSLPTRWGSVPPTGIDTGLLQITNNQTALILVWTATDVIWTAKRFYVYVGPDSPELIPVQSYPFVASIGSRVSSVEIQIAFGLLQYSCRYDGNIYIGFYLDAVRQGDGRGFPSFLASDNRKYYRYSICCCPGFSHVEGITGNAEATYAFRSQFSLPQ